MPSTGRHSRETISPHIFLKRYGGCSREETIKRVSKFYHSSAHIETKPVAGAVEAVHELSLENSIVIITSRPESVSAETLSWLNKHFPNLKGSIYFARHFFHGEGRVTKGEICKELEMDIFVDDFPHHVEDVARVVRQVLLFDTPWNRNHTALPQNARRVHSWNEIRALLGTKR